MSSNLTASAKLFLNTNENESLIDNPSLSWAITASSVGHSTYNVSDQILKKQSGLLLLLFLFKVLKSSFIVFSYSLSCPTRSFLDSLFVFRQAVIETALLHCVAVISVDQVFNFICVVFNILLSAYLATHYI